MTQEEYEQSKKFIEDRLNQVHPESLSAPLLLKHPTFKPIVTEMLTMAHWFSIKDPSREPKITQQTVSDLCNEFENGLASLPPKPGT